MPHVKRRPENSQPTPNSPRHRRLTTHSFAIPPRGSTINFRVSKLKSPKSPSFRTTSRYFSSDNSRKSKLPHSTSPISRSESIKREKAEAAKFREQQRVEEREARLSQIQWEYEERKRSQREQERQDESEKYQMFLNKDRAKVEEYQRRKAERNGGLRSELREKSDGICVII